MQVDLPTIPRPKSNKGSKPDPNAPVDEILSHHNAVLQAAASGTITPDEAERLSNVIDSKRRAWESTQLADRLTALGNRAEDLSKSAGKLPKVTWVDPWDKDPNWGKDDPEGDDPADRSAEDSDECRDDPEE